MRLTVREALSLEPLNRARVIAGSQGLDKIIQSVNVMEVPDILDWVRPGQLLVTTMYPLKDSVAKIECLVPGLVERGLAGLVVKLHRYIDGFPEQMLQDAERLAFPIIELPADAAFSDVIQPITSRLLDFKTHELRQSEAIHRQFLDLVLNGGGFSDIANALAQLTDHPVTIADRFGKVLAHSYALGLADPYKQFVEQDGRGDSYFSRAYQPKAISGWPEREARLMRTNGLSEGVDLIHCPVKLGATTLGEIIVWGTPQMPPESLHLIAIEHGATITALKMMEVRSISQVEERFRNEILFGLLSDNPFSQEQAIQKSPQLGTKLVAPFAIILVGADLEDGNLSLVEQNSVDDSLYAAKRYLRGMNARAVIWYHGPQLVVFYPLDPERAYEASLAIEGALKEIAASIKAQNPFGVSFGISGPEYALTNFRQAYACARQSLEIGQLLADEEGGAVTHYSKLGIFRTMSLATGRDGLERFCQDTLGPLISYDRQHGTELLETLRVYLEMNQNASRAAEALFIHYNTLRYRLKCMEDIVGNALDDPQKRLAIEVALQLYPLCFRNR